MPPHFLTKSLWKSPQLRKRRHFVLKFRGSLMREKATTERPGQPTLQAPLYNREIPQVGICKWRICNHDHKAKWLLKIERRNKRGKDKTQLHQFEKWTLQRFEGWLCTLYWFGSFTTCKKILETLQEQHHNKRVPGLPLPGLSTLCSQE